MHPRASILRSRWRPGGPSETPRAYSGGLGGDVGAPGGVLEALGEHFGALRATSGSLGSAPGTVLGAIGFFLYDFVISFARMVVASICLYFGCSPNLLFFTMFQMLLKWRRSLPIGNY